MNNKITDENTNKNYLNSNNNSQNLAMKRIYAVEALINFDVLLFIKEEISGMPKMLAQSFAISLDFVLKIFMIAPVRTN